MKIFIPLLFLMISACRPDGDPRLPEGLQGPMPDINRDHALTITPERVALTRAYFAAHNPDWAARMPTGTGAEALTMTPRIVVVHYTALPTLAETTAYFAPETIAADRGRVAAAAALNVGIQFIVDRDGTIYASYPETATSRHVIGLNHVAVGIENVGDADLDDPTAGKTPLTGAQLDANEALVRYLAGTYPTLRYLIGHSEYRDLEHPAHPAHALFQEAESSYRTEKVDPGPRFLAALRARLRVPTS